MSFGEKNFLSNSCCVLFFIFSDAFFNLRPRSDSRFDEGASIAIIRVCVFCGAICFRQNVTI